MKKGENESASYTKWMYATIPANIAAGPLGTLIPLYILMIGGGALEVAYALTLFNTITIPAAYLWGRIADSLKRKTLILFSYIATTALIALLLYDRNVVYVITIYALIAFVTAANGTPLNLLVMETTTKERWSKSFSILQVVSGAGTVLGLIVGVTVTGAFGLDALIITLAFASFVSVFVSLILIIEPKSSPKFKDSNVTELKLFIRELIVQPVELVMLPIASLKETIVNRTRKSKASSLRTLYIATILFYIGTGIFNTEYAVGLKYHGLNNSGVFAVVLIASIIQVIAFDYSYKFIIKTRRNPISSFVVGMRGLGYALIGMSFIVLTGTLFFISNIILSLISAGIAYALFYTSSYALLFNALKGRKEGNELGIYSAITGVGNLSGSFASGIIAVFLGFPYVFISAGLFVAASAYAFSRL